MAPLFSVGHLQFLGGAVAGTVGGFVIAQQVHFTNASEPNELGPCWSLARSSPTESELCVGAPEDLASLGIVERTVVLCQELGLEGGSPNVSELAARACESLGFRDCSEGHLSALSCLEAGR